MKTISTLKDAQDIFPDAIKLKLRIDSPITTYMVRKLIPESVTIIFCKISKNYVSLIYSQLAKEQHYPDVTRNNTTIKSGEQWMNIYCDEQFVDITTSFCPSSYPEFTGALDACNLAQIQLLTNYPETRMGYLRLMLNDVESERDKFLALIPQFLDKFVTNITPVNLMHAGTKDLR